MRNKYRLSIMIVLIIMLFMYIAGVVGVAYELISHLLWRR